MIRLGKNRKLVVQGVERDFPLNGTVRHFRVSDKPLTQYEYDTLDMTSLGPSYPASVHYLIDEVDRYLTRSLTDYGYGTGIDNEPRMTTKAKMFAPLRTGEVNTILSDPVPLDPELFWTRPNDDNMLKEVEYVRNWGENKDKDESVGISFTIRKETLDGSVTWFDNALLTTSNLLWEFNTMGGAGRWWQLYDIPNRAWTRITLPYPTDTLRLRCISNMKNDYVQTMAIVPYSDYSNVNKYVSIDNWKPKNLRVVNCVIQSNTHYANTTGYVYKFVLRWDPTPWTSPVEYTITYTTVDKVVYTWTSTEPFLEATLDIAEVPSAISKYAVTAKFIENSKLKEF